MTEFVRLAGDARFRVVGDEVVLIQQSQNRVLVLNPVAGAVLALLEGGIERDSLVQRLKQEYEGDEDHIRRDIEGFLASLEAKGLLGAG